MCRSDGLIGLSSTRTSASPGAKGGVGISASFNTLFGSPVSRKINAFINTSWVFRRRLISGRMFYDFGVHLDILRQNRKVDHSGTTVRNRLVSVASISPA